VALPYPFISEIKTIDGIKIASIEDIGAMKLSAITGRGSRKDFVDLYFLLQIFTLDELLGFYGKKYRDGSSFLVFKSLTYFDDAEQEPMPHMRVDFDWAKAKKFIVEKVKTHFA